MTTTASRPRRMARQPDSIPAAQIPAAPAPRLPSKLDQVETLLLAPTGASIAEIMIATGWQQHSVRGAMASALRKRGLAITSQKVGGIRRYRAGDAT